MHNMRELGLIIICSCALVVAPRFCTSPSASLLEPLPLAHGSCRCASTTKGGKRQIAVIVERPRKALEGGVAAHRRIGRLQISVHSTGEPPALTIGSVCV